MDVPRGGNAHFKESVYELHKRESHGFSPSVSHRLDHEVSLQGAGRRIRERIRTIIRQVCRELGVQIVSGVLSREHVHMFVEIPPHIAVSDFVRRVKGRSSHRVQMEFPDLRKRYWGQHSGSGLLLHHERQHHGRCHTSVSSGARTYRRQPVVIQLQRRNVLDVLPVRSAKETAEWLAQHPEIEIVSRDRCGLYAQGIREGAPQAKQVADRFHLLQNLREIYSAANQQRQPICRPFSSGASPRRKGHLEEHPTGVMTSVRVRSAVDRSILGLSSRLPERRHRFSRWCLNRLNSRDPPRGAPVHAAAILSS